MEHEIISTIKSCIASQKGGVPLKHIDAEYCEFTGESIPFHKLGFQTLGSFISSIPDIGVERAVDGSIVLNVVDEKIAHITALVEKQKSAGKKKLGKENICSRRYSLNNGMNANKSRVSYNHKNNFSRRYENYYGDRPVHNITAGHGNYRSYRTARMVDNMLKITVRADAGSNTDVCYISDDNNASFSSDENILDVEPSLFDHQMIGDDFFLHIAKSKTSHKSSAGLCVSGQTIRQCLHMVRNTRTLAHKVMILIGAVDVLLGKDVASMKADMLDLIEIVAKRANHVVIVTIPPLVNICHLQDKWSTLVTFNKWLKQFATDYRCRTVDTWPLLKGVSMYDYYEAEPRKLLGRSVYIVLWNRKGRDQIIQLLRNKIFLS